MKTLLTYSWSFLSVVLAERSIATFSGFVSLSFSFTCLFPLTTVTLSNILPSYCLIESSALTIYCVVLWISDQNAFYAFSADINSLLCFVRKVTSTSFQSPYGRVISNNGCIVQASVSLWEFIENGHASVTAICELCIILLRLCTKLASLATDHSQLKACWISALFSPDLARRCLKFVTDLGLLLLKGPKRE